MRFLDSSIDSVVVNEEEKRTIENDPVNFDHVTTFTKSSYTGDLFSSVDHPFPDITFYVTGNKEIVSWVYPDEDSRNSDFDRLASAVVQWPIN